MPVFDYKVQYKNKSMSAIGCYMNYLEIGNLIIFPVFAGTAFSTVPQVDT